MFQVIRIRRQDLEKVAHANVQLPDIEMYKYRENGLEYRCVVRTTMDATDRRFYKEMEFQEHIRTPGHPAFPPVYAFAKVEYGDNTIRPATIEDMVNVIPLRQCVLSAQRLINGNPAGTLPILLPPGFVLYILSEIASSLAYLHKKGIVARSVHPNKLGIVAETMNIRFLTMQSFREEGGEQLTMYVRTPITLPQIDSFTPPEWEDRISPAWDLWSLAALGYYLLTGREILDPVRDHRGYVTPTYDEQSLREKLRVLRRTLLQRFGIEHLVNFFENIFLSPRMRTTPIHTHQDILVALESKYGLRTGEIRAISRLLTAETDYDLSIEQTVFRRLMNRTKHAFPHVSQGKQPSPKPPSPGRSCRQPKPQLKTRWGCVGRKIVSFFVTNTRDFQM